VCFGELLYREAEDASTARRLPSWTPRIFKTFFSEFDEAPKSGIYCKAPLNTAALHRKAKEDRGDAAKAARKDQIKNLIFLTTL